MEFKIEWLCLARNEKIPQNSFMLLSGIREDDLNYK
jgi:hypothetical protein